jgi:hypothetical protein
MSQVYTVSGVLTGPPVVSTFNKMSSDPLHGKFNADLITLSRHTLQEQYRHNDASGDLTLLLTSLQLACKYVASCVRKAGLVNLYATIIITAL